MKKFEIHVITLDNQEDIDELQKVITTYNESWIKLLLGTLKFPITIVYEEFYVDKLFRDSYYTYFSSKHFEIDRTCGRLTLFEGKFTYEDFLNNTLFDILQKSIIGTIVLRPTKINAIGRTLLNPDKLHIGKMYVQRTKF